MNTHDPVKVLRFRFSRKGGPQTHKTHREPTLMPARMCLPVLGCIWRER